MPTATEYFGYAAVNYGPLTTTFTADRSCATASDNLWIYDKDDLRYPIGDVAACASTTTTSTNSDCYPSYSKIVSQWSASRELYNGMGVASYFSPGVACPSGWTTAGTMARATPAPVAAGESVAWNGTGSMAGDIFKDSSRSDHVGDIPMLEVYRQIMAPEETLAYCCPSGYDNKCGGNCCSSVAPLTAMPSWKGDLCWGGTYYAGGGVRETPVTSVISSTITTEFWSPYSTNEPSTTYTYHTTEPLTAVVEPSLIANLVVMTVVGAVPLIHKASDVPNAAAASLTPAAGGALALVPLATVVLSMFAGVRMIFR
ncbi:hypothetical protein PG984_011385 [Apiospora sp. TS-2023a]